jgi:hypothetical protein
MLQNDRRGRYYSKASSLAVPFRFCSHSRGTDIIYMTAPVYITYMAALLDFTLLHAAMKNVCVLAVVGYGKKVHKRASSAARLCWKFTTFQKRSTVFICMCTHFTHYHLGLENITVLR